MVGRKLKRRNKRVRLLNRGLNPAFAVRQAQNRGTKKTAEPQNRRITNVEVLPLLVANKRIK
jgi:hypothetical protein